MYHGIVVTTTEGKIYYVSKLTSSIMDIQGIARLINWLGTVGPLTALIDCLTVILEYIDLFQFLLVGHSQLLVGPGPYQARALGYASVDIRHDFVL